MAWLALAPLIMALAREPGMRSRRAFLLGLVCGAGYFGGTVYWTPAVVRTFGGLHPIVAVAVGGLLVAYLALFPALFAVILSRLVAAGGHRSVCAVPVLWAATELLRRHLLGGFPWVLLGSSQATVLPILQTASLAGVYGLSALVSMGSAAAVLLVVGRGWLRWAMPVGTAALTGILWIWGAARVADGSLVTTGDAMRVALVQGNIRQEEKWNRTSAPAILSTYLRLTQQAARDGARLVVWPESSTPFFFEYDAAGNAAIRMTVRESGIHLLFGSDQYEAGPPARYFNSAFLLRPDGTTVASYKKMHLVPFGEYVPLKRLLFFAGPLVEAVSDFSPGEDPMVMPIGTHRLSTAICYEVVYPDLIAAFTGRGSQLLTTITNDAWYGDSSAPYQHFWQAAVRAVEQGRYLVRAANTGISGIVDPYGRVVASSGIFEQVVVGGDIRFLTGTTVYGQTGDAFAYACALATVLAWFATRRRQDAAAHSR